MICTLALVLPGAGEDRATQTGQGSWTRVQKKVYAFTARHIRVGPDGNAVGWVQFWGDIRPDAPDHFTGEINAACYELGDDLEEPGTPMSPIRLQTEGWRVEVQGQ